MVRSGVLSGLVVASGLGSVDAVADDDEMLAEEEVTEAPIKDPNRTGFSPVLVAGNADGLAAGAQLDLGVFALRGTFGYFPLLVSLTDPLSSTDPDPPSYEFFHTCQVNVEAMVFFLAPSPKARLGVDAGNRYNSLMGHGIAFGGQGEFDLWSSTSALAMLTLSVYPEGTDRVLSELGDPDKEANFPFGAGFNGGLGLGLKF
jgi:hypothetical protein